MPTQLEIRQIVADRIGRDWCLFLDRDGVINRQIVDDYVRSWADFEWLPRARDAIKKLSEWAPHLVVVTNQQGVGKHLMSIDAVTTIHQNIQAALIQDGVTVNGFQVCPHLESQHCSCRKPQPGLVLDWLNDHPAVEASLSVVAGDSPSDMELAQNVATAVGGCVSIGIGGRASVVGFANASFNSLWDFAVAVEHAREELGS
ncbi:histidinol-phosphate phosphatase family protein [Mycolicibacterium sp. BK556]|nr:MULTISPECIES: HAD family hydrolase [Mycobacteriaceae]MBB3607007.1 histidinol-phosphate phosphatase family protein [Mycolicibacterium sp. BK556]MBB3636780.1 histidinol-phosphate phosphatase family protein [Mycolicibacterium sp. BK607]MBB3747581.1 histidinol-phosphate phosphatase family protein [Mycolicibacterium sp. BK634]TDO08281.1 D-glycero-D-manno-heptose 1,7-bisphosphate phosphatase [Mycobacterium sp. BK086]